MLKSFIIMQWYFTIITIFRHWIVIPILCWHKKRSIDTQENIVFFCNEQRIFHLVIRWISIGDRVTWGKSDQKSEFFQHFVSFSLIKRNIGLVFISLDRPILTLYTAERIIQKSSVAKKYWWKHWKRVDDDPNYPIWGKSDQYMKLGGIIPIKQAETAETIFSHLLTSFLVVVH